MGSDRRREEMIRGDVEGFRFDRSGPRVIIILYPRLCSLSLKHKRAFELKTRMYVIHTYV